MARITDFGKLQFRRLLSIYQYVEFYWYYMVPIVSELKHFAHLKPNLTLKGSRINYFLLFHLIRWTDSQLLWSLFAEFDSIFH
jgi:hypothetical protein